MKNIKLEVAIEAIKNYKSAEHTVKFIFPTLVCSDRKIIARSEKSMKIHSWSKHYALNINLSRL